MQVIRRELKKEVQCKIGRLKLGSENFNRLLIQIFLEKLRFLIKYWESKLLLLITTFETVGDERILSKTQNRAL